jgi:hypothetical protein
LLLYHRDVVLSCLLVPQPDMVGHGPHTTDTTHHPHPFFCRSPSLFLNCYIRQRPSLSPTYPRHRNIPGSSTSPPHPAPHAACTPTRSSPCEYTHSDPDTHRTTTPYKTQPQHRPKPNSPPRQPTPPTSPGPRAHRPRSAARARTPSIPRGTGRARAQARRS